MDEAKEVGLSIDSLKESIPAYSSTLVDYKRAGKSVLKVELKAPVVVGVASKPEKWGYFQFPTIEKKLDNSMGIRWNLNADAIEAYGDHKFGGAVSKDGGVSWQSSQVSDVFAPVTLVNGDRISVHTPKPIKVSELSLPKPSGRGMDTYARSTYDFYKLHDLPESRQGVYIDRLSKGATGWKTEIASLYDPQAARYAFKGLFPVLWWGDMHVASDKSIIAGIYPGFLIKEDGSVDPKSGAFFYRSVDHGHSWKIQGRITYIPDISVDANGDKRMGFTEPAFEILSDGTFICVLRTTDGIGNGPMYISRSSDLGVTWTRPEVLTASGVLPRFLHLQNGVTVLSSGRPGVQLRFSNDGKGKVWTEAFEMMPYKDYKDQVSCGYTGLLATGNDKFLIVYSDFKYLNQANEVRKAIKVREVIVTPK
ncbi:MAG: sialidase family protein [Chitinophagaceae bacterium]